MTSHRLTIIFPLLAAVLLNLQGCSAPVGAVKPVAEQNQKNVGALSKNVQVLLELYAPLLKASGDSLLYQHMGKVEAELIAVVGPAPLPPKANNWDDAFTKAANSYLGRKGKFGARYQRVKVAIARGVGQDELDRLKIQEGWVYTAATNPGFSTTKAHDLVKTLSELRRTNESGAETTFYQEAERRLTMYDPKLGHIRSTIDGAEMLLDGLKTEINKELDMAHAHSQALVSYADSAIDMKNAVRSIDPTQVSGLLKSVGEKYISDPQQRDSAISMLTKGASAIFNMF